MMALRQLRLWKYLALRSPTYCLFLYTWTMSSTLLRGPCTPFASCSLTGCRCLLCNRCSTLLSSRSSPMPLRLGGASPHPQTASVLLLFLVERTYPDSGHRLCRLSFLLFQDLCSTTDDELFTKTSTFSNHIPTCISPTTIHRITMIRPQMANTLLSAPWTLLPFLPRDAL